MPPKKGGKKSVQVESLKHKDKRTNIPTRELQDFVREDEAAPKTLLYPRDPSLDPQLVWKGKDDQDRNPLEVSLVPVYIQEKIHPHALVENLRKTAAAGEPEPEQMLFSDFNGIKFEDMIEFYHHEQNWTNRMILGDSLLVMSSLAEKEGLKGKVQMVYIDPPYGIKFGSNWQVSTRRCDVKDSKAEDVTRQPEQVRAFRDTWQLGIHSYLAYLRDRLVVTRELLTESGSVFVQIGDENVHLVRNLLDEVLGSGNFISLINFRTTANLVGNYIGSNNNYLLWYAKDFSLLKYRQLYRERTYADDVGGRYTRVETSDGVRRFMTTEERMDLSCLPSRTRIYRHDNLASQGPTTTGTVWFEFEGHEYHPGPSRHWATNIEGLRRLATAQRLAAPTDNSLCYVRYLDDFPVAELTNVWTDTQSGAFTDDKVYVVQTNTKVIERCILMTTDPGDLVLDPTCGSGTTAYVTEQWGRRWITIDTSRVSLALARTRLMCAKYPYYTLADSPEGVEKEAEITGKRPPSYRTDGDIRKGFVYKRVPHVTLKSIANNPEIRDGMTREEIDRAIAKYADTETLFDQPYEDGKRIRVTGPFTVESLSPHRVLAPGEEGPESQQDGQAALMGGRFEAMIIDNLKKAGVQNTKKKERLVFDRLEPFAGEWLHAAGEYTEAKGKAKRVAVSIGPEHGTVGPELVKEAAKEAVRGVGFDLLVVCGFAFDAHAGETAREFTPEPRGNQDDFAVAEETREYGKLRILLARMNPDLAMGDELLKKTGAANLFMVFGEPDIDKQFLDDGTMTVEIRGVDVYDPTTGQIRSDSTDDIACWFLDTDYNGESFFVRHAYFTGAGDPYDKLKRALRAEIDETAWATLYTTRSRPFPKPSTGKFAVKVINHYGDEVLKVYEA